MVQNSAASYAPLPLATSLLAGGEAGGRYGYSPDGEQIEENARFWATTGTHIATKGAHIVNSGAHTATWADGGEGERCGSPGTLLTEDEGNVSWQGVRLGPVGGEAEGEDAETIGEMTEKESGRLAGYIRYRENRERGSGRAEWAARGRRGRWPSAGRGHVGG